MNVKRTFNSCMVISLLEEENFSMGAIQTQQKKPYVLVQILGISEKTETGVKAGDKVYIDTTFPKTKISETEDIYVVSEKALAYEA